jgi:hypothetical protein
MDVGKFTRDRVYSEKEKNGLELNFEKLQYLMTRYQRVSLQGMTMEEAEKKPCKSGVKEAKRRGVSRKRQWSTVSNEQVGCSH